ncbi:hypothetical protein FRC17_009631 [Serendipita sp. 399]|nr:hypothetical protein FRC17_009631 [Serendipita sp. 399]
MAQRPVLVLEDNILFAQIVYQLGASDWQKISEVFTEKSTQRGKRIPLNGPECHLLWTKIITRLTNQPVIDPALKERTSVPLAPDNLTLVKALYNYRLQELHNMILLKEAGYHLMRKEIAEIQSGAWDQKIVLKKSTQIEKTPVSAGAAVPTAAITMTDAIDTTNPAVLETTTMTASKQEDTGLASSSSSQLSSLDSPAAAPAVQQVSGSKKKKPSAKAIETSQQDATKEMKLDEEDADTTLRQDEVVTTATATKREGEEMEMEVDETEVKSPPLTPATPSDTEARRKKPTSKKVATEEPVPDEGQNDASGEDDDEQPAEEDEEEEKQEELPPAKSLRSKKGPALEPLQIPTMTTTTSISSPKTTRKGKGRKSLESVGQPATATTNTGRGMGRRRGGGRGESKAPMSPASVSVAGTFESAPTPTDENASVAEDGGRRRSTRGHKRKHSEMEVDLPPTTPHARKTRDRSTTVDDESAQATTSRTTTTAAAAASASAPNPRLRQSMTQFLLMLMQSEHSEIFRKPVTSRDAPDYAQAVKRPVDLTSIQKAVKMVQIRSWDELERDLRRMLANCCMFNRPKTGAFELAKLVCVR